MESVVNSHLLNFIQKRTEMKSVLILMLILPFMAVSQTNIMEYEMPSSIRAIQVVNDREVWFAGSNGVVGHTIDGGKTWTIDSIRTNGVYQEFRSIVVTQEAVQVLTVGSPAVVYRSTNNGKRWKEVYREEGETVFYDAMFFKDDLNGVAVGDNSGGCMSVILTSDGGKSWSRLSCVNLPDALEGEGCFAASNSNIDWVGENIWFVTTKSRVFKSIDNGKSWQIIDTPILKGGQMTGIYSVDFLDKNRGIIVGGDWNKKEINFGNIALTRDGGNTWELLSDGMGPGYRSCVRFLNNEQRIIAISSQGFSFSEDFGYNWHERDIKGYYAFSIGETTIWLSGNRKIGKVDKDFLLK